MLRPCFEESKSKGKGNLRIIRMWELLLVFSLEVVVSQQEVPVAKNEGEANKHTVLKKSQILRVLL